MLSILGTSAAHASDTTDKIKTGSAMAGGLAAGAAVGKFMPGPLAAKIAAGAATTILTTPWLILLTGGGGINNPRPQWKDKAARNAANSILLTHPIAAPVLALTAGICVGKSLQASTPVKVLAGSALAAGIMAAGTALWGMIVIGFGMAGGTGAAG